MTVVSRSFLAAGLSALALAVFASGAMAQSGGPGVPTAPPPATDQPTVPGKRAKLTKKGVAIAPAKAPQIVKDAIAAGNRIRKKPYIYGGGHRSFKSKGYDCSGAVSFVLNAAAMLESPIPSGPLMKWGMPGKGRWITVYAHGGHTYAVIAGLRWDTSAMGRRNRGGKGPRWRAAKRSPKGFATRHYEGY